MNNIDGRQLVPPARLTRTQMSILGHHRVKRHQVPRELSSADFPLPHIRHELRTLKCYAGGHSVRPSHAMPAVEARASTILVEFSQAQAEIVGKAVILTDGKAGTVDHIWLDELHGLRISIRGHEGKWPVSTIRLAQPE